MSPRERQMRFRRKVKETMAWMLMLSMSFLMIIHWVIVGY